MDVTRQIIETKDFCAWVAHTATLLVQAEDLLNDLNTFPVPNFNTGTNLAATWSKLAAVAAVFSPHIPPDRFMAHLASVAAKFPRGSSGMFTAASLAATAKTWREVPLIRPVELVQAVSSISRDFQNLDGEVSLDFGLTALVRNIEAELAELNVYTLSAVMDTTVVCAQQLTVDSADTHRGVGDAGLAGACLILASLADVVASIEGKTPGNTEIIQSMLTDWADRSRPVVSARRAQTPGTEFEVTFRHTGYAREIGTRRQELGATCSEVLELGTKDELGFATFTTHVHTAAPLSILPHPHENILVEQLSPPESSLWRVGAEDPVPEKDNVVLFTRRFTRAGQPGKSGKSGGSSGFSGVDALESGMQQKRPKLVILSEAPALVEMYARGSATVLLNPSGTDWVQWALGKPRGLSVLIPSSPATWELAKEMAPHETAVVTVAPSRDELSALWLSAGLATWQCHRDGDSEASAQREIQRLCTLIRVEEIGENLKEQLEALCAFAPGDTAEIMALIGARQPGVDRVRLRSMAEGDPRIELTIFYGGQSGATLLGVKDDTEWDET
ncbi:DAK2 domain fusion protein YloV [Mobiluncus mulieris]|uniref:hypothetical protein n=1 Tax=Mobiluncus mulieris TaxID=2052 RepID=UPI00019F8B38|nr:hypothetical protein [Mobiluncus mulieris]EEJ54366.1 hypothetical protein HMPREF0577_0737 [Mobiluncus mulieris ATCC 35243]MCV0010849.1 hypothetical protein [Mobiluncus mulieris]SPX76058.1 DAK2 domain fusion protein YloV [Mobiluncus mulieris]